MALNSTGAGGEGLGILHQRLDAHFHALRRRRDQFAPNIPIFALEHGLSEAELALLNDEVRSAISRRHLPREPWLSFVVYAAEVGYDYCGDEYWQTFESRTPGWAGLERRHYIRDRFHDFRDLFGGAEPTGAWAQHFSIICWPITHAVLPTDLQRQLARLLFDYRRALTSDELANPLELGTRLTARSWHYSSRFHNFAQDSRLLGQVAAALLVGDDEESPYLLDTTLRRIVESLEREHEARRWLREAKSTASRVRMHGFRPSGVRPSGDTISSPERPRLVVTTDPGLVLREGSDGWAAYLDLPDLSVLAERLPTIHEELGRLRARLAGVNGPPLARGRLLFPGQRQRIDEWPDPRAALVQLENGSASINRLLADQCVLSPGPPWLFRIREPGFAVEVRGKFVRPGHEYVLVVDESCELDGPTWVVPARCATVGARAFTLKVPTLIEPDHGDTVRALGLGLVTDVVIRPAGIVPGGWDGEGAADWIAGEDIVVALSTTKSVARCVLTVDGTPHLLGWPEGEHEIFVGLTTLNIGIHDVQVSLLPVQPDEPAATGSLRVDVRPPHSRPPSGTFREGLMLLVNPAVPTLSEFWDGRAAVELMGPKGTRVSIEVSLADRRNTLATRRFRATLPVDSPTWRRMMTHEVRKSAEIQRFFDDSEIATVTASHPGLGVAQLRCEREFAPLRWAVGRDREGPFVRLVDNTDGNAVVVERYDFGAPADPVRVEAAETSLLRWAPGGLIRAAVADFETSVVLPPRGFDDLLRPGVVPRIPSRSRTVDGAVRLVELARLWKTASLPADPLAEHERHSVLQGITRCLVSLVAGGRWARLEESGARDDRFKIDDLQDAVGDQGYQRALAAAVTGALDGWRPLEPEKRARALATALVAHGRTAGVNGENVRLAEFLLRLASEPASLSAWSGDEIRPALELALTSPVLLRTARLVVLGIHAMEDDDAGATYRGWAWP